jgi:hypothetical protein
MKADNRTFFSQELPTKFILLLFLLLSQLTFTGCRKDEESAPGATPMTLSASLDGKPWEASGFLVEKTAATATSDAALLISSRSNAGGIRLNLYLYGVDRPGTYVVTSQHNNRYKDAVLEVNGDQNGLTTFFGWGPTTYTITKVEGKHYAGTFSGSFADVTRNKTIQVTDGKFDVLEGVQGEQ